MHRLLDTIWKRQYALIASTIAVLLAPLLTIAVSALYTAQNVSLQQPVTIQQIKPLNHSAGAYFGNHDLGANPSKSDFAKPGLTLSSNLSFPTWTYEELVFPMLSATPQALGDTQFQDSPVLHAIIPATRDTINCTVLPDRLFKLDLDIELGQVNLTFNWPECFNGSNRLESLEPDNGNALTWYDFSSPLPQNGGYFGGRYISFDARLYSPFILSHGFLKLRSSV